MKQRMRKLNQKLYNKKFNDTILLEKNSMKSYINIVSNKLDTLTSDIKKLKNLKEEIDSFNKKIYLLRILAEDKSLNAELKSKLNLNLQEKLSFFLNKKDSDIQNIKLKSMFKILQKKLNDLKREFKGIISENDFDNYKKKLAKNLKNIINFSNLVKKIYEKKQNAKKLTKEIHRNKLYKLTIDEGKGKGKSFKLGRKLKKYKKSKKNKKNKKNKKK